MNDPVRFNQWVEALAAASDTDVNSFEAFLSALKNRHDFFHSRGGRLSDHGLNQCYAEFCSDKAAEAIFDKTRGGKLVSPTEHAQFASFMMLFFGRLDAEKGWTKQLHLGALRNTNTRLLKTVGPDTGFDSIGDFPQAVALSAYLDRLDQDNALPKTIIYNNNPIDNYLIAAMIDNLYGNLADQPEFRRNRPSF